MPTRPNRRVRNVEDPVTKVVEKMNEIEQRLSRLESLMIALIQPPKPENVNRTATVTIPDITPGDIAVNNDDLDDFYEPNNAIITQNEPKKRATLTPP